MIRFSPFFLTFFLLSCSLSPAATNLPEDRRSLEREQTSPVPSHTTRRWTESAGTRHRLEPTRVEETALDGAQPSAVQSSRGDSCSQTKGTLENGTIASELLHNDLLFQVYLPPCYASSIGAEYPTLYLLHGQGYNESQWDELGADEIADNLISSDQVAPFIMVMPYEQLNNNNKASPFDKAILEELLPFIERNYRTRQDREARAVGGISRGGGWAIELGLHNREVFGALGAHSPAVLNNNPDWFGNGLQSVPAYDFPRIFIDLGDREPPEISESAAWLGDLLNERGLPHEWYQFSGEHNQEYWQDHLEMYLRWYASAWY